MLFQSEVMHCSLCHREQKSDAQVESGWYALQADSSPESRSGQALVYACPRCIGNVVTPECPQCRRYYHEDYAACPWCRPQEASHA